MMEWLLGMLVAFVGIAHAIASWLYFARRPKERWWLWSVAWVVATVACIAAAHTAPIQGYGLFAGLVAVWTFWWVTIQASTTLEWVPENRYQATGEIVGDTLTVDHRGRRHTATVHPHAVVDPELALIRS